MQLSIGDIAIAVYTECTNSVTVIVAEVGLGKSSSNSGFVGCICFCANALGKGHDLQQNLLKKWSVRSIAPESTWLFCHFFIFTRVRLVQREWSIAVISELELLKLHSLALFTQSYQRRRTLQITDMGLLKQLNMLNKLLLIFSTEKMGIKHRHPVASKEIFFSENLVFLNFTLKKTTQFAKKREIKMN